MVQQVMLPLLSSKFTGFILSMGFCPPGALFSPMLVNGFGKMSLPLGVECVGEYGVLGRTDVPSKVYSDLSAKIGSGFTGSLTGRTYLQ